eukprot:CAMPEP_0167744942 /NCGR_PEP_ID=MMETSP0110_2-20121227/2873_1 /TAXON_ID=629695 /ORGANISM="Gymnochlora sp., Strain CCMP2014" /LENGTH=42 /DNA_ID= /DNA_START= /DNA_END= /DNA_ORIENTATION=
MTYPIKYRYKYPYALIKGRVLGYREILSDPTIVLSHASEGAH